MVYAGTNVWCIESYAFGTYLSCSNSLTLPSPNPAYYMLDTTSWCESWESWIPVDMDNYEDPSLSSLLTINTDCSKPFLLENVQTGLYADITDGSLSVNGGSSL